MDTVGEKTIKRFDLEWPKLTPYDRRDAAREYKKQRRARLLENLKAIGFEKGEMLGELQQFDELPEQMNDFYAVCLSPSGQVDLLMVSLTRQYGKDAEAKLRDLFISAEEQFQLCADISGVKLKEPPKPNEGDEPNVPDHKDDTAADAPSYGNAPGNPT